MNRSDAALLDSLSSGVIAETVRRQGDKVKPGRSISGTGVSTFDVVDATGREEIGTAFKATTADGKVVPIIMRGGETAGRSGSAEVIVPKSHAGGGRRVSLSIAQATALRHQIALYTLDEVMPLINRIKSGKKEGLGESAPPGWKGSVKAMKKHMPDDRAFALAWSMYKKGAEPHYTNSDKPKKKKGYQSEMLAAAIEEGEPQKLTMFQHKILGTVRRRGEGTYVTPSSVSDDMFKDERTADHDAQVRTEMFRLSHMGMLTRVSGRSSKREPVYVLKEDFGDQDDLTFIADPVEMQASIAEKLGLANMQSSADVISVITSMYDAGDVPAAVYAAALGMGKAEQNISIGSAKLMNQLSAADIANALVRGAKATGGGSVKNAERWWMQEIGKFDADRGSVDANSITVANSDEVQPYIDMLSTESIDDAFNDSVEPLPIGYGALSTYRAIGVDGGYQIPDQAPGNEDLRSERSVDRMAVVASVRDDVTRDISTSSAVRNYPDLPGNENRIKPNQYTAESLDSLPLKTRVRMAEAYDKYMGNAPDMSADELVDAEQYRAMLIAMHSDPQGAATSIANVAPLGKVTVDDTDVDGAFGDSVEEDLLREAKEVGSLVRYVGPQYPKLAGMEGEVISIDGHDAEVRWKNGTPTMPTKIGLHELKTIRAYSKKFR